MNAFFTTIFMMILSCSVYAEYTASGRMFVSNTLDGNYASSDGVSVTQFKVDMQNPHIIQLVEAIGGADIELAPELVEQIQKNIEELDISYEVALTFTLNQILEAQ